MIRGKPGVIPTPQYTYVTSTMTLPESPGWIWRPAPTGFMVTKASRHHKLYRLDLRAPRTRTGIGRLIPESWMSEGVAW